MAMVIQTMASVVTNRFPIEQSALKFERSIFNQVQIDDSEINQKKS